MKKILISLITITVLAISCTDTTNNSGEQAALPVLLSHSENKASCVFLTKDEKNDPVASWCETDTSGKKFFFFSFFNKAKNAFTDPVSVPLEQNAGIHEEGMPKIAVKGDGTIIAIYETAAPTKENEWAGFVHYIQSFDKGKTWTKPKCVHDDTTQGKDHSFASVARLSDGEIGACWLDVTLDPQKQARSVKFAKTNGRNGFQKEILVDSFACQCCRTAISSGNRGNISITFRDILADSIRDISLSTSADNGKTFTPATSFSHDHWVINGCPHAGPSVAEKNNISYAAWFTGGPAKGIYYAALDDKRNVIAKKYVSDKGRFIQLCLLPDGQRIIAYNEAVQITDSFYNKIVVGRINDKDFFETDITSERSHASFPVLCSYDDQHIVVAWTDDGRVYYRIINSSNIDKPKQQLADMKANPGPVQEIKFAIDKDAVCGMDIKDVYEDTAMYRGKIYGFCSKHCKEKFLKEPGKYSLD